MTQFFGTYQNKLDAKGRVSIPAQFRTLLKAQSTGGSGSTIPFILRPSHLYSCIEAWPQKAFETLAESLNDLEDFSEDQIDLATAICADAFPAETDREGRIVLPADLAAHAGVTDAVAFVGVGKVFQLWEPNAAARRKAEARERSRDKRLTLKAAAA
jgi:MraZ protein